MSAPYEAARSQRGGLFISAATLARLTVAATTAALALVGAGLFVASFASYERVKRRLDSYASDGDAGFSRHTFHLVVVELRVIAPLLVLAAVAVHVKRRPIGGAVETLFASISSSLRQALARAREAVIEEPRIHFAALGLVTIGALLVRLEFLFQPMRYDESGTFVHYGSKPLYIGLTSYTAPNNHLFHTLLVHLSYLVFGDHAWAIRLPAFVAGVLLVPATYLAARALYGRNPALLAAGLVASASLLIEYSTNARGYMLVALIFVLLLALATYLRESPSPAAWAAFVVLAALGVWTVPTMLYALGTVVLWLVATIFVERSHRSLLKTRLLPALAVAAVLSFLLYLPVLAASGAHALFDNEFVAPRTFSYLAHHLPGSMKTVASTWNRDVPLVLAAIVAAGFVVAVVRHSRVSRFVVPPAVAAVVFILPLVVAQRVVPFERVWLFLLPLYLMTAAAGLLHLLGRLQERRGYVAAIALVAVAACASFGGEAVASQSAYNSEDTSTFRDAKPVTSFLKRRLHPGDRVLALPPADLILEYYFDAYGLDATKLLYTKFEARRMFAVVKVAPNNPGLMWVLRDRLPGKRVTAVLLRRFPHAAVYEVVPRRS
jgi:hypothetical protein